MTANRGKEDWEKKAENLGSKRHTAVFTAVEARSSRVLRRIGRHAIDDSRLL